MKFIGIRQAIFFFFVSMLCLEVSHAQVMSPLPFGIIQKVGDSGFVRFILHTNNSSGCKIKVLDQAGNDIAGLDWHYFLFHKNLDTSFSVPLLRFFDLTWQTTDGEIDSGIIKNLSVGYIFAIAGQSNAQGWSYPNYIDPQGLIRMLLNDSSWEKGHDPTGGKWASPWIEFANKLQDLLNDGFPIGLVNVGEGGTGLVNPAEYGWWKRNDTDHFDTTTVYGKALTRFLEAGGKFEALFWIQGESDATGTTSNQYQSAFKQLIENFEEDLGQPITVFHLQIDGQNGGLDEYQWGQIREAQRKLPPSTLIGTAAGAPIGADGIHYSQNTLIMVGDRFAGAVAGLLLNTPNDLYPPLMPFDTAYLTATTSRDPFPGYKITIQCFRGTAPTLLQAADTIHGFQVRLNSEFIDTSNLLAKLDPDDSTKIDIFKKDNSFSQHDHLQLSFATSADVSHVNVTDTSTSTVLPNYLVAFMDIPVVFSEKSFVASTALPHLPNLFSSSSTISLDLLCPDIVSYDVFDISGKRLQRVNLGVLSEGNHLIQIPKNNLAIGVYHVILKIGSMIKMAKIIISNYSGL